MMYECWAWSVKLAINIVQKLFNVYNMQSMSGHCLRTWNIPRNVKARKVTKKRLMIYMWLARSFIRLLQVCFHCNFSFLGLFLVIWPIVWWCEFLICWIMYSDAVVSWVYIIILCNRKTDRIIRLWLVFMQEYGLQCFDAVGWVAGRASSL